MKVTDTKCVDGKRHNWELIWTYTLPGVVVDFKWCSKCGCKTEFSGYDISSLVQCRNEDGSYYIQVPKCHRVWEEKHGTN